MKDVEIVFASNNEYLPYLGVAISSIIRHSDLSREYHMHVLHKDIDEEGIKRVMKMAGDNIAIDFIDVSEMVSGRNYYGGVRADTKHITAETFYRLLIPELFPDSNKVLYLDCDLIAADDVGKLYDIDLNGKTIGAVGSAFFWHTEDEDLFPDNEHEWFNAGVMLWDVTRWIEKGYSVKCEEILAYTRLETGDQELLQIVCFGDTRYLPHRWNLLWHHAADEQFALKGEAASVYDVASGDAGIIHYSGRIKPWHAPEKRFADVFWEECRRSGFYEQILYSNLRGTTDNKLFSKYVFPFGRIPKRSDVVLYGAGVVGKIFRKQVDVLNWCKITAWSDKNYDCDETRKYNIISPDKVIRMPYDYVVVAVERESTANAIKADLESRGIEPQKIIWENPLS